MREKIYISKKFCGDEGIQTNGARLGDLLIVNPLQGRKKEIVLNRRELKIKSLPEIAYDGLVMGLPGASNEFDFDITLLERENKSGQDEHSRYVLKSNNLNPFKINGTFAFEALLERGDVIDIGYNRLKISSKLPPGQGPHVLEPKIIDSDLDVLLEGETGTGKSRLAKIIHEKANPHGKFVQVNLSAFSLGLIESELFGHVKGAFTGAISNKKGALSEASHGTLFLDEIDSLPWEVQTKLLLFLDSKEVRPVGGTAVEKVKVRLIFATGQDLKKLVETLKTRKDFYYRINAGFKITLTPLRKDPGLLFGLCDSFCLRHNVVIPDRLRDFYKNFPWPGNVRQFLGHLEKKRIFIKGNKFEFDALDESLLQERDLAVNEEDFPSLEKYKLQYVFQVFQRFNGDISRCKKVLNVSSNTVKKMVGKYQSAMMS
jgi:hypothetical protein